jgi:hypothetical protein
MPAHASWEWEENMLCYFAMPVPKYAKYAQKNVKNMLLTG